MKYLERLLDPDQLIDYPSECRHFNAAYEDALACLSDDPEIELYIVKYRDKNNKLHFSFVSSVQVSADKPSHYGLNDICAVLRK